MTILVSLKTLNRLLWSLIVLALVLFGCSHKEKQEEKSGAAEKTTEKALESESRVKHGTNGETVITLDSATQKLMGLQTAALQPAQLLPELKAYGRVLDVAPLTSLVAEMISAQAASAASQAELVRLKTLAGQSNASERALQSAEAAAARDQTQAESIRLRLLSGWGREISERPDLSEFVRSLSLLATVLVQLQLPAGQPVTAMPTEARVITLTAESTPVVAKFLGPAPLVDPQLQGRGFLFQLVTNSLHLAPGAAVEGLLSFPGDPQSGIEVPSDAIVRFNGATWVYRQTSDADFVRQEVKLASPLNHGWFVRQGLKLVDKVVIVGAQELLSEELKGQAGE
ncbi:MAG TPA: hypothetical protein VL361_19640 [Candidatus Limnocylindrales bacterium]|jgi:hypothetical protein|nr:hypothetical protein [Candidatus Limnocylindrales bacterium]